MSYAIPKTESVAGYVRRLTAQDIAACVYLGSIMHAESSYACIAYNQIKVAHLLRTCVDDENHFAAVAGKERIDGFIAGYVTPYFFSDELIAQDFGVFVRPDARGARIGASLVKKFRDWAFAKGCLEVCLGITTGVATERTTQFYESLGFERAGNIMKLKRAT